MRLTFVPHAERWRGGVRALNDRLAPSGAFGFFEDPTPAWLAPAPGRFSRREYVLAVDDGGRVRGGYVLQHELAVVAGRRCRVASVQGPYSEGVVDPRYALAAFAMARDMVGRQPLLYGWGLERRQHTVVRLFRTLGWRSAASPVLVWVGPPRLSGRARVDREVDAAGDWADEVWDRCGGRYDFAVQRDRAALEVRYPPSDRRFRRVVVRRAGAVVGWAVVGVRTFRRHPRFRSARVGVLWDFFAAPEDARDVVRAAHGHLRGLGAWVVLASAAHGAWTAALRSQGFRPRGERHLLVSAPLAAALDPFDRRGQACFLTYGDAEGHRGSSLGQAVFDGPVS